MGPIIALTTDFGTRDAYVAAMKAVILGLNPQVAIVDLCHEVSPQDVSAAAYLLGTTYALFPPGTIHVVVVDPGVGTERRGIAFATGEATFVGPDNGVFSYVLADLCLPWAGPPTGSLALRPLGPALRAVVLTEGRFWRQPVSRTFHGRDVFAPVAAHLSLGVPLAELGDPVDSLLSFAVPRPTPDGEAVCGAVIYIDGFGNLITNIRESDLPGTPVAVDIAERRIEGLSDSYADGGELLALVGSSGRLEVAMPSGSAAATLGVGVGAPVTVWLATTLASKGGIEQ